MSLFLRSQVPSNLTEGIGDLLTQKFSRVYLPGSRNQSFSSYRLHTVESPRWDSRYGYGRRLGRRPRFPSLMWVETTCRNPLKREPNVTNGKEDLYPTLASSFFSSLRTVLLLESLYVKVPDLLRFQKDIMESESNVFLSCRRNLIVRKGNRCGLDPFGRFNITRSFSW